MASVWTFHNHFNFLQPSIWRTKHRRLPSARAVGFRTETKWNNNKLTAKRKFLLRAVHDSLSSSEEDTQEKVDDALSSPRVETKKDSLTIFRETVGSWPPIAFVTKHYAGNKFAIGLCIAAAFFVIAVRVYVARKLSYRRPGSVSDLVRRGQLRSDRRGISRPLKYEDPFNNSLVKIDPGNSTVEMCGKVYRLAPVTLTEEEQAIHQKRRSKAYQWKRPTTFLKEGDPIPPDVDPDTVRWIPTNHPFATTASEIDEGLAQNNVYQKHGVPFRIQAEHEALQKKLEALQNEQKLNKLVIDGSTAKDFERSIKMNSQFQEPTEQGPFNNQVANSNSPKSDDAPHLFGNGSSCEEMERP